MVATNSEEKKVAKWKARIEIAKDYAKKNFTDKAKRWRDFYKGEHFPQIAENKDRVVINYTYSILKSIIPQLYYQDPYIYITAKKEKYKDSKQLVEDAVNFSWQEMRIKKQMRKIILDMLIYGFGVGKVGYYTDLIENPNKKSKDSNLETDMDYSHLIKDEYPFFLRQSPLDMVFDYEAKNFDDIRWLATKYSIPLDEAKKKYKNTKDLEGNSNALSEEYIDKYFGKEALEDDLKRVTFWEAIDLVDGRILTISEESDKFHRNEENPYEIDSNYQILYVNEVPDELYPISEIEVIEDLNLAYDKLASMLLNHLRKSQRKIMYPEDFFDEEEEQKFLNDDDMAAVKYNPSSQGELQVFDASMTQPEFYNQSEKLLFDINNTSRTGFNQRATEGNTEKTATEANIIEQNANLGNSERLDCITDYSEDLARNLIKILQSFASKEKEFYVDNRKQWQKFKKEDIAGDYNVKIDIGSTVKKGSDEDLGKMSSMYEFIINMTDETGKLVVDRRKLTKMVMDKFGLTEDEIKDLMTKKEEPKEQPQQPQQPQGQSPQGQPQGQDIGQFMNEMGLR